MLSGLMTTLNSNRSCRLKLELEAGSWKLSGGPCL